MSSSPLLRAVLILLWAFGAQGAGASDTRNDAFTYLEQRNGTRALEWVKAENARTLAELEGDPRFRGYYRAALESEEALSSSTANASSRLQLRGDQIYSLATGPSHPRGVWRRTSVKSFLASRPDWRVLLDVDALSKTEHEDWTFASADFSPSGRRCLLSLYPGGSSVVIREFDLDRRAFVEGGFRIRLGQLVWRTDNTVFTATDFGPGTLNAAGEPLIIKQWARDQPITEAKEIFHGQADDISVGLARYLEDESSVHIQRTDRANQQSLWQMGPDERLERLSVALPAKIYAIYRDQYILRLDEDWRSAQRLWRKGSLVAVRASDLARFDAPVGLLWEPGKDLYLDRVEARTPDGLILSGSELNSFRLWRAKWVSGSWSTELVPLPDHGIALLRAADAQSPIAFVSFESALQSPTLYALNVARNELMRLSGAPAQFDGAPYVIETWEAQSADGAQVPYTVVRRRAIRLDGGTPVLLEGYGAAGYSTAPAYSGALGRLWLKQGGAYVFAHVRGGSERGPQWAVKRAERRHTYEDAVAVAEDLIRRKLTEPKRIGFTGHSAGGLLAAVMLTQYPQLFGAVVLYAPLTDQFRFDLATGGPQFWSSEFGSLEIPEERAFLERTSPFQNLRVEVQLPKPLILSGAKDENVYPGQPRRFAAKMAALGKPFLFWEASDGGHALAATAEQRAYLDALIYTYLARQLIDPVTRR